MPRAVHIDDYILLDIYSEIYKEIENRAQEFNAVWNDEDETALLKELYFCLLTPQTKAEKCWDAVESLDAAGLLLSGDYDAVFACLKNVRFNRTKTLRILETQATFILNGRITIKDELDNCVDEYHCRLHMKRIIKGFGMKESSHFLRNIGRAKNVAILDRHILKMMFQLAIIDEVLAVLSDKQYLYYEEKYCEYAHKLSLSPVHFDLLLWYITHGVIFK